MKCYNFLLFFFAAVICSGEGQHPGTITGERLRIALEVAEVDFSALHPNNTVLAHVIRGEESGRVQYRVVPTKTKENKNGEIGIDHSAPVSHKPYVRTYGIVNLVYFAGDFEVEDSFKYDWSVETGPLGIINYGPLARFNIFAEGGYLIANYSPDAERDDVLDQIALLSKDWAIELPDAYLFYQEHSDMFSGAKTPRKVKFFDRMLQHRNSVLKMMAFRELLRWDILETEAISSILEGTSELECSVYVILILKNLESVDSLKILLPYADGEVSEEKIGSLAIGAGALFLENPENSRMLSYLQRNSSFLPRDVLEKNYPDFVKYEKTLNSMPSYRILRKMGDLIESGKVSNRDAHVILSYAQFVDGVQVPKTKLIRDYIEKHSSDAEEND